MSMPTRPAKQSFSQSAKIRLIERDLTISALAKKLRKNRTNVSLVINQRRRLPKLELEIRKELDLEELAA